MLFSFANTRPAQIKLLYRPMPYAVAAMFLVVIALYVVALGRVEPWLLTSWAAVSATLLLVRIGLALGFYKARDSDDDMAYWLKLYFWTLLPVAVVFGVVPLALLPHGRSTEVDLILLLILGVAAGGAATNAPHPLSAITFIALLLGPLIVYVVATDTMPIWYGFLIVVLMAILMSVSLNMGRFLTRSLQLQEEKDAVIACQRKAEENLRRSEEDFRQLVEGSIQGILIADADRKPLFCNDECARMFGFDGRDEFLALPSTAPLIAPHEVARLDALRQPLFLGQQSPLRYEFEGLRKDGSTITLNCMASSVNWQGNLAAYVTLYDITDQKRAEEKARQSMKLEAVGQLTGGIAHDFNNLLAVILGNAELLGVQTGKEDRNIDGILRAAHRGGELTHQLLSFSRRQPLMPGVLDFSSILSKLSSRLSAELAPDIVLDVVYGPDLWTALADPVQVENALVNLVDNARDAMPAGGTLTISCNNTILDDDYAANNPEVVSGDYVAVAVSDTGSGMSDQVRLQAFEPFFTTKGTGEGSGLGLSMVYGFAKQSGGHVEIDSTTGQGTTVRLYLPRAKEVESQLAANDR